MLAQSSNMNLWLNTGTVKQKTDKLVSLGVGHDDAESAALVRHMQWRHLRSESGNEMAILFTPCDALSSAGLYLLQGSDKGWYVIDGTGFDCHYDNSVSVEIASFRNPNVDDIFVHHECEEHGTGYVEQHFNVLAVSSGKFKTVLDTQEVVRESDYLRGRYDFHLRSKFVVISSGRSASRIIQETQCVNENGKISVEQRRFNWNESAFLLVPTNFVKLSLGGRKITASCR